MAENSKREWSSWEETKDLYNLVAQKAQADALAATARASHRQALAAEQNAEAAKRGAAAQEEQTRRQEEHFRKIEGIEQQRLEVVKEERQLEQRSREAKDGIFSLKLHADELVKGPGNDPLSSYIRLQMLSRELRAIPRQLLDEYDDKALHAEVSVRLNEGLGDLRAMAPSEIECFEQILRYGQMVGLAAVAIDAYWDLREIAPLRIECNALNTKYAEMERQIEAKRESSSRAGHWVTFFIVMLAIMVPLLMIIIRFLKNSSPAG